MLATLSIPLAACLVMSSCILVAIGGSGAPDKEDGTVDEVRSAIEQERPVLLVSRAGWYISACHSELMELLRDKLVDPELKRLVLEINEEIAKMGIDRLKQFFQREFVDRVAQLVEHLASSSISRVFERSCAYADEKWWT